MDMNGVFYDKAVYLGHFSFLFSNISIFLDGFYIFFSIFCPFLSDCVDFLPWYFAYGSGFSFFYTLPFSFFCTKAITDGEQRRFLSR